MPGGHSLRGIERLGAGVIHEHVGDQVREDGEAQPQPYRYEHQRNNESPHVGSIARAARSALQAVTDRECQS